MEMVPRHVVDALAKAFEKARDLDAPVNERLAFYTEALTLHSAGYAAAAERMIERWKQAAVGAGAPQEGEALPSFLLPDDHGRLASLEEFLERGPAVIVFHRGHWCPYCRINGTALARLEDEVSEHGARIVSISPEREAFAAQQKIATRAGYRHLSDMDNGYALSLNLAIALDQDVREHLLAFGRDLAVYHDNPSWFLPIPATFVVAPDGLIARRFIDPDYRRRMDGADIIAALKSLR